MFSECVSCHGNHGIQKASLALFDKSCVQCHANDPKQLGVRDAVAGLIRKEQSDYEHAVAAVHDATVRGLATEDDQLLLQEAKTQVTQLESLQHTLSLEQLKPVAAHSEEIVNQTLTDIAGLERFERWKRNALVPIWVFLTVMAALFWAKRRQLDEARRYEAIGARHPDAAPLTRPAEAWRSSPRAVGGEVSEVKDAAMNRAKDFPAHVSGLAVDRRPDRVGDWVRRACAQLRLAGAAPRTECADGFGRQSSGLR